MTILKEYSQKSIKLLINGRIGNNTCSEFQEVLLDTFEKTDKVILDFSELEYINSTGLRALLLALQKADDIHGELLIKNVNENVMELFMITGFDDILCIV